MEPMRPLPPPLSRLIDAMMARGATDLLISGDSPPVLRISGYLEPIPDQAALSAEQIHTILTTFLSSEQQQQFEHDQDFDFSFAINGVARLRCSVYVQRGTISLALRALPLKIPSLSSLGLPPVVADFALAARGLVIVTGATGSGKSTTLAAMIDLINQTAARHVVTIEDPIEFVHDNHRCLVEQREIGRDTPGFARALRGIFRQNPDVILVGEMRDLETVQTVLTIAETGHLTFATLHTNSCASTVHRIIDAFPVSQQPQIKAQLGLTLVGVVTQALLPRSGGGLALATEVMVGTPAIKNLVREGKAHQIGAAIESGQQFGMRTLNQSLAELLRKGLVTEREAFARTPDSKDLRQLLAGAAVTNQR
jgi:twitching motility protein PilT